MDLSMGLCFYDLNGNKTRKKRLQFEGDCVVCKRFYIEPNEKTLDVLLNVISEDLLNITFRFYDTDNVFSRNIELMDCENKSIFQKVEFHNNETNVVVCVTLSNNWCDKCIEESHYYDYIFQK